MFVGTGTANIISTTFGPQRVPESAYITPTSFHLSLTCKKERGLSVTSLKLQWRFCFLSKVGNSCQFHGFVLFIVVTACLIESSPGDRLL